MVNNSCGNNTSGNLFQTSLTTNGVLYATTGGVISSTAAVASGVLVTSAGGVPSVNATVTSWTPVLAFSGASVGITYGGRTGGYYQIGKTIFFDMTIVLTSKGTSVGQVGITGLPANPVRTSIFVVSAQSLTYTGQVNARMPSGDATIAMDSWATGGARALLSNTAFVDTTIIQISGSYLLS